jgi:hypothetical protein
MAVAPKGEAGAERRDAAMVSAHSRRGPEFLSTDMRMAMLNELNDSVLVTENSRHKTILKLEVMVKQLVNKAVSGDLKSIKLVHDLPKYWNHPSRQPICFLVYPEDPIPPSR